jgi:hypothetical protein
MDGQSRARKRVVKKVASLAIFALVALVYIATPLTALAAPSCNGGGKGGGKGGGNGVAAFGRLPGPGPQSRFGRPGQQGRLGRPGQQSRQNPKGQGNQLSAAIQLSNCPGAKKNTRLSRKSSKQESKLPADVTIKFSANPNCNTDSQIATELLQGQNSGLKFFTGGNNGQLQAVRLSDLKANQRFIIEQDVQGATSKSKAKILNGNRVQVMLPDRSVIKLPLNDLGS